MPAGAFTVRAKLGSLESRVGEQLGHKDVPAEERRALIEDQRAFVRDTKATGEDERNVAEAALTGAFLAAGAKPPDQAAVLELTADFEKKYPKIDDFFGDPAAARKLYDEFLAKNPTSNEAQRGAAKAAVAMGDRAGAIAYWRQVVESSTPGGTAWFEARVAQVQLLAEGGSKSQACELARGARGKSTSAGADQLSKRLSQLEAEVCK